jgi:hypothetical protein
MGVDGTGSGSCPVASFGISGVEPSGSANKYPQYHVLGQSFLCVHNLAAFINLSNYSVNRSDCY